MPAFDAMKLFARYRTMGPFAANDHAAFLGVDVDVVARESGDFSGQNEAAGGFEEVDRWIPSGCVGADKFTDLFMQREQVSQRIPACERHLRIVTRQDRYYGCERMQGKERGQRLVGLNLMCYDSKDIRTQHGVIYTSHSASQRHADQGWQRLVPHPRTAPPHPRQQARPHPVPNAEHSDDVAL